MYPDTKKMRCEYWVCFWPNQTTTIHNIIVVHQQTDELSWLAGVSHHSHQIAQPAQSDTESLQ